MNAILPINSGTIPPRSVTIHKADSRAVAFEGFGTVIVTGPRQTELSLMISALPKVLRSLVSAASILRTRDGDASVAVDELEAALSEAGISLYPQAEDIPPMSMVSAASPPDRLAILLGTIADRLDALLADKKGLHSTPTPVRDALSDISLTIRRTLREADPAKREE